MLDRRGFILVESILLLLLVGVLILSLLSCITLVQKHNLLQYSHTNEEKEIRVIYE